MTQKWTKIGHAPAMGGVPYLLAKKSCLQQRGLLSPEIWPLVGRIACAVGAHVEQTTTSTGERATAVTLRNVTVVLVRDRRSGNCVPLTVFAHGLHRAQPISHLVREVAQFVTDVVDVDSRVDGRA
jgi:hypothetical protein